MDVGLCAVIQQRHLVAFRTLGGEDLAFLMADASHSPGDGKIPDRSEVAGLFIGEHGVHHALFPQQAGDLPGVHAADARDAVFL